MISLFAFVTGLCLTVLSKDMGHTDLFLSITIVLFSVAFFLDIARSRTYTHYIMALGTGYVFRIALLYYDVYSNNPLNLPLVGGPLSSDPLGFYRAAINYSQGLSSRYGGFFPRLLGGVFAVTGPSRLLAEFIVLLFSLGTLLVFVKILEELGGPRTENRKAVYLIALLPNYAFLSVILRRETIITFFVALSLLYFIRWFRNTAGERAFLLSVVFALLASLFHGATGMIIVSYLFVHILYSPKRQAFSPDIKSILAAVFFIGVAMIIYGRYGTVFFGKVEAKLSAGVLSGGRDAGGSSYARYVGDAKTPVRMLIYAIPRFMYYLFSPFPWQWRGFKDIMTFLMSSAVYLLIFIDAFRYLRIADKKDEKRNLLLAILLIALVTTAIFSWGVVNTGTATRHRDKIIVMYGLLYVLSRRKQRPIKIK